MVFLATIKMSCIQLLAYRSIFYTSPDTSTGTRNHTPVPTHPYPRPYSRPYPHIRTPTPVPVLYHEATASPTNTLRPSNMLRCSTIHPNVTPSRAPPCVRPVRCNMPCRRPKYPPSTLHTVLRIAGSQSRIPYTEDRWHSISHRYVP